MQALTSQLRAILTNISNLMQYDTCIFCVCLCVYMLIFAMHYEEKSVNTKSQLHQPLISAFSSCLYFVQYINITYFVSYSLLSENW